MLFDNLGAKDREWSRMLGALSCDMHFLAIERMLDSETPIFIAESAFWADIARPTLQRILQDKNVECLEIYCQLDDEIRKQRFADRVTSGERHPGHVDHLNIATGSTGSLSQYAPLKIGEIITVDTGNFGDAEYATLKKEVGLFCDKP